jgi:hypothetical protein
LKAGPAVSSVSTESGAVHKAAYIADRWFGRVSTLSGALLTPSIDHRLDIAHDDNLYEAS